MPAPDAFKQVDPKLFDEVKSRFLALYEQNPKEYDEVRCFQRTTSFLNFVK